MDSEGIGSRATAKMDDCTIANFDALERLNAPLVYKGSICRSKVNYVHRGLFAMNKGSMDTRD